MTEGAVNFQPANSEAIRFDLSIVQLAKPSSSDLSDRRPRVGIAVINAFESNNFPQHAAGTIKWEFKGGEHPLWLGAGLVPRTRNAPFIG